jgi:hypothetical protein
MDTDAGFVWGANDTAGFWLNRRNKVGDLGAEAIAEALIGLVHLTKLDLRYLLA